MRIVVIKKNDGGGDNVDTNYIKIWMCLISSSTLPPELSPG
jgi:hypothetical protein